MRILLIEDDSATAQSIQLMLKSEGYICDTTDLGEDGLEIGKLYDYDIMVLDLMLPDIDGYEVVRRLREARVETPPVVSVAALCAGVHPLHLAGKAHLFSAVWACPHVFGSLPFPTGRRRGLHGSARGTLDQRQPEPRVVASPGMRPTARDASMRFAQLSVVGI